MDYIAANLIFIFKNTIFFIIKLNKYIYFYNLINKNQINQYQINILVIYNI